MLLHIFQFIREWYSRLSYRLQLLLLQMLFYIMYVPMMLMYLVFLINARYLIPAMVIVIVIVIIVLYTGIWSINLIH